MHKMGVSLMFLSVITLEAESLKETFKKSGAEVNGYLRGSYHSDELENNEQYQYDAIGGKLHFKSPAYEGLSLGTSLYFTSKVVNDDEATLIPLRGESDNSYAIFGEAYLQGQFGKTVVKLGRQELNTPFADMDDIGMIPNTFEAATLVNKDIEDTEIFVGQINKMSGVDAEVVDKFTTINGSHNMQVFGLTYEGIDNLVLSAWYNRLKDAQVNGISYLEANYENSFENYTYGIGVQYANQSYLADEDAEVLGLKVDAGFNSLGLLFSASYNEINDNAATSGFGGGPFFAAFQFLVIDNAGKDAMARTVGLEYDATTLGLKDLTLGLGKMYIETENKTKATEFDVLASYQVDDSLAVNMVYADLKAANVGVVNAKHFHVYLNYSF